MRFSLNFVKEFLDLDIRAKDLAQSLTMAGMEVEYLEKVASDWIFDIEVTTNRYDWLSVVGVSKEIAAVTGRNFKLKTPHSFKKPILKEKNIVIKDKKDCPYYIGRLIRNVNLKATPLTIKDLVTNCGISSINNVVDITNYCMLKWGNPLHVFDADKIEGDICIRRANKNETFLGIDEKNRVLTSENLVIADSKKIIALAGVMGAKNTEVSKSTRNIFLEAAIFSPLVVRRSRRAAGLDTESSYRFERRVSSEYLEYASCEAMSLIIKESKAADFAGFKAVGKVETIKNKEIKISILELNDYLGAEFKKVKVKQILKNLGCRLKEPSKDSLTVFAPSERFDLEEAVDIYEELARIYGYDKIKPQIPSLAALLGEDLAKDSRRKSYHLKNNLRKHLTLYKFKEIITFSLENSQQQKSCGFEDTISILNPLRSQENSLRSSLLLGMLKTIQYNLNRNQKNINFYEIADIYNKTKQGFLESSVLSLGSSGCQDEFFYLKGSVSEVLKFFNINKFTFKEGKSSYLRDCLAIVVNGKEVGVLGRVSTDICRIFDLKKDTFFAQMDLEALLVLSQEKKYKPFSAFPAISRDISIILKNDLYFKAIERVIKEKSNYLFGLKIVDTYKGKDIPANSQAFTLRIFYQSQSKTLTASEVDGFHNAIREALSRTDGVRLR